MLSLLSADAGNIIGVRAGARTGYVIPGCDGMGGWGWLEILPPSPPPRREGFEILVTLVPYYALLQ